MTTSGGFQWRVGVRGVQLQWRAAQLVQLQQRPKGGELQRAPWSRGGRRARACTARGLFPRSS